ncbi:YncE family protein, partial [Steroidobacter sp.]|uniref:YncE family protein n=1 Tax=Steroidobacter sp. TaxID=1978227 RepID=UPI001A5C4B91
MLRIAAVLVAGSFMASAQAEPFYRLESALTIESPNVPNWDYLTFDPSHNYLYISRREDGVLIYDTQAKRITGTIENTVGGNAITLVPEFDRGYVTNLDGSATIFQISTLKALERVKFGKDADNAFYDPVTKQLLITMGDSKRAAFLDAKTGKTLGTLDIDSEKLEGTAADGNGNMYMALRDRNKVIRIDMKKRQVVQEWSPANCELPNGVAYDAANKRLFVSCRGNSPVLLVIDPANGKVVASPTIGRGNDVVVFDADARKIYTSNGFDGTLVIIDQVDANTYKLAEATTTRPYARTMALDPKTKKVYLATAEGTVDPAKKWKSEIASFYPNKYFLNTFT